MEYICFFHPRVKGNSPMDLCAVCERPLEYPSNNPPALVGDYEVQRELGRGFYAVAYQVRHPRTGVSFVMKVTPRAVYDLPDPDDASVGGYGDRRDFEGECRLHSSLSDIPEVARILDWGEATVTFGSEPLAVYWTLMDLVRGELIENYYTSDNVLEPRAIAQVAVDLLRLSEQLHARKVFHNDLHGGNAIILELAAGQQRRRAIDPGISVQVIDLGSASSEDKADPDGSRLGDVEQICIQLHRLLNRFDVSTHSAETLASDVRLSAQLRRVAQTYERTDWATRRVTPTDMLQQIQYAVAVAVHPEQFRPMDFFSLQDHYNAQTLPAAYARSLIYDPDGQWTNALTAAGPQLVVGMRGCGKTMLLRSLEWSAHAVVGHGEGSKDVSERVADLRHLGLFVSCAHLLRAPRERVGGDALQRLYLAYAREAIRAVQTCEILGIGEVDPEAVDQFCELVSSTVPTFDLPNSSVALTKIELQLNKAIQKDVPAEIRSSFIPLEAFTELARGIRRLVNVWANKVILFLLDDVSKRYLSEEDLSDLLAQFCLKNETFGFKISTETQTQVLLSPTGERALEGRDYQVLNLGWQVLAALKGQSGVSFLQAILDRRQALISGAAMRPVKERLGTTVLENIAQSIRRGSTTGEHSTEVYYHGLNALAAVCVGDIGDVLQIYHKMNLGLTPSDAISSATQHSVLLSESRLRLLSLVKLDVDQAWFFHHATAYANASHRELTQRDRVRQYADVFVEISSADRENFRLLMSLIDNGVYVMMGFRERSKSESGPSIYQFALRYRKLFGLQYGMPLANRDRFELTGEAVSYWLREPRSDYLTSLEASATDWDPVWVEVGSSEEEDSETSAGRASTALLDPTLFDLHDEVDAARFYEPDLPRTTMTVEINSLPLGKDTLAWANATLVAGVGFEDRAIGSLQHLLDLDCVPGNGFLLARYAGENSQAEVIEGLVRGVSEHVDFFDVDSTVDPTDVVSDALREVPAGPVIVDVSALNKPLIYSLTQRVLAQRENVFVMHTSAADYDPEADELRPVLDLLDAGEFVEGLKLLDTVTPGEGTEFIPLAIGQGSLDASARSLLVSFVTLKYRRLDSLLEGIATDKVVGVRTTHSSGEKAVQSRAVSLICDYLVASQNGDLRSVGAMDAEGTFKLLMEYYDRFVLDSAYRLDVALTGTKMQTVGAAAFASVARVANTFYSVALNRDTSRFTHGTGHTRLFELRRKQTQ
jgi:serine/threonine protein kinase